ncbi:neprilysin-2-like [Pomacea canaliculata]|uniref:neprilysin-2-like n=1 Tax=Pomacea canaliculata TaxID=400727 RepID=UPI000D7335FB|nr:neprilysin-2-like [Pomacea canaliculata]XP_025082786.1 neprilysin-2-like [Pomacea canaliculata]XP_025082787.1 neprilysin-2-like [Pomacea canaliculata]XP_025082788.1 neprilysin-2-like [Pomacea canaliculata]XP_025082789.1 neprilysin-2-like [Pomacea canaliculata]XP_025082791.1 neprilysin-2-like [Pomacea canaliculata]
MSDTEDPSIGQSKESGKALTPREKFHAFLSILLFVASVIFLALFVTFYTRYEAGKGAAAALEGVCQTFDCLESAAYIAKSIDSSVDPCKDFYQFACGRWVEEHPIPAGERSIDTFKILNDEINEFLKDQLRVNDSAAPEQSSRREHSSVLAKILIP